MARRKFTREFKISAVGLVLILATAMGGCTTSASGQPPSSSRDSRSCGFYNATKVDLARVAFTYQRGERIARISAGYVSPGNSKLTNPAFDSIPEKGTVHWQTRDKKMHQQEIPVAARVPGGEQFAGTIWFIYENEGWVVKTITKEEATQRAKTGRYSRPDVPGTSADIAPDSPPESWLRSIQTPDRPALSGNKYAPYLYALYNTTDQPISDIQADIFLDRIPGYPMVKLWNKSSVKPQEALAVAWNSRELARLAHVKITWEDDQRQAHHQQLSLADQIKDWEHFSGIIWLVATDKGWEVRTRSFESGRERAKAGQANPALPDLAAGPRAANDASTAVPSVAKGTTRPKGRYLWAYYNATTRPISRIELRNKRDAWMSFPPLQPKQAISGGWAGAIVKSRGWPAAEVHAASLVPSLKITPAITSGSNALPLSFRHFC
jgi:hypothetical protein